MTKRQLDRRSRLLPHGRPRWIRCYDNGGTHNGGSIDRYTVVYTGRYKKSPGQHQFACMSAAPFHSQGVCQHGENDVPIDRVEGRWGGVDIGRLHPALGRRIEWEDLPADCQKAAMQDYRAIWDLPLIIDIAAAEID